MSGELVEFVLRKNVTNEAICANIVINEALDLPHLDFKRVAVCASGPSLADHIEDIRARQQAGWHVASMNGSHNYLIENGIVPDLMFIVDARPVNLPFLRLANTHTTYIVASQVHPEVFDALTGCKVLVWSMFHDDTGLKAIKATRKEPHAAQPLGCFIGSVNVGQSCLVPLWAMGYKTWHLFGYDGSMRGDAKHAFVQPQNADETWQEFSWPRFDGEIVEGVTKTYWATPTMAHASQLMPERVTYFRNLGVEVEIFGEGLLPDMVKALASRDGAATTGEVAEIIRTVPDPKPRRRAVEKLPIVTFKWAGHIPYFAHDVNVWGAMVDRHLKMPHELVLITDDGADIDGSIRQIPLWRDEFEHGRDWHRVKLFAEEMADTIGPRFAVMDLDTVICGALDPLFYNDAPFVAWHDPNRDQYCTAVFMMDAGAYPHVWSEFDAKHALRLRQRGFYGGYDQAWISHMIPGLPRWTATQGVLSFRVDLLKGHSLDQAAQVGADVLPEGACVINFHGKHNPRDADVQAACPWVASHWHL